jgi:tellurite resistance protein
MSSCPPQIELVHGLAAVTEDALFAVAAAGEDDEDVLSGLGKRRGDVYENVIRGKERVHITTYREWMMGLAAAIAPVRPPRWMPMAELVSSGITVEGGARGVRALFTSKPSEKKIEHVRRVGALAVRALVAVLCADGPLDVDEEDLRAALVASFGLPEADEQKLLTEPAFAADELEIYGDLEAKLAREVVSGAWLAAAGDGIDPREERVIGTIAKKLGVRTEEVEAERTLARKTIDDQRDVGAAIVDAIRYVLVDEPEHAIALGKVAARLFLPRRHRLEPLSALHQRGTITLANRFHLGRTGQSAVLAASWLAVLHTDPSIARRVPLLLRHEDVARDLRADGTGAFVREKLDRIVESQLQVAALAAGS